ncbi:MAG: Gfo/Idh/MocA family oxidoreductase [Verrucomicrobia bacterium]|nr:Gfo/Idh/MocA family oxidoreductase [Verrucomicrobiota bacterium]
MPVLKIGLIGCGHIGRVVHLNILRRLPQVEVVALAETDAERRQAACRLAPRAAAFADYQELLARRDVDAVVISLPNALHVEAAIAALQHGKHVYLEKPLAINLDGGRRLLEVWRGSGRVGTMGFNYRFNPLYEEVGRLIQAGRLGEILSVRSVFTTPTRLLPEWKQTRQSGGGVLLDLASHHVDLVRFWFGREVREVSATVRSQRWEADTATVELRLANGLVVQSSFSLSAVDEDRFEIHGRAGNLRVDRYHSWGVTLRSNDAVAAAPHPNPLPTGVGRGRGSSPEDQANYLVGAKPAASAFPLPSHARGEGQGEGSRPWISSASFRLGGAGGARAWLRQGRFLINKLLSPQRELSYGAALARFAAAARANQPTGPDFEDGYRSLAVVIAAEESARVGRVVALPTQADEDPAH